MVEIAPFRGVVFNPSEIADHGGLLVAPPYDVLDEKAQKACLDLHPHNILHVDYGLRWPDDPQKYSWHERSGRLWRQWLSEGIIQRLDKPAVFHVETTCRNQVKGGQIVRHGFVCLMKLEEFSLNSRVRPHEKTFSSHKEERLGLMKETSANLSQVFGFFPDEDRRALNLMKEAGQSQDPDMDFTDYRGYEHRVWIDYSERAIGELGKIMAERRVYIADGHHRYETALNYRRWLQENNSGRAPAGADYVMIYLCPMSDPGLVIFPTHRLMHKEAVHPDEMINRLSRYFKVSGKSFNGDNEGVIRDRFLTKLRKQKNNLGLYMSGRRIYYVLKLLESAREEPALAREVKELAALDMVILSNLVFKQALGLTEEDLDNPERISYVSDLNLAINQINREKQSAAFILNPSTLEDILRVTEKGLTMPRKSTFFYPKCTTGLVMNLID
ncbi:MAG: DUF1015 domain-containing protein [Candidatus Adiutrix sp.]|nr:DUF1015 domain-containing protein [Candidatus Adiutrix sp.]